MNKKIIFYVYPRSSCFTKGLEQCSRSEHDFRRGLEPVKKLFYWVHFSAGTEDK